MKPLVLGARVVAWCLVALVVTAVVASPGGPFGPALASAEQTLVLSGDVQGLAPGQPSVIEVTLANAGGSPLTVSAVSAAVTGGGPGCGAEGLVVTAWAGSVVVPAHGSTAVALPTRVADLPACAGQQWSLEYSAT